MKKNIYHIYFSLGLFFISQPLLCHKTPYTTYQYPLLSNSLSYDSIYHDSLTDNSKSFIKKNQIHQAIIVGRSKIRQIIEKAIPVSIISSRELKGSVSSINEVLSRVAGITIRNTGGIGSSSRISVRGLEGKRIGIFIDDTPIGQLSDYISLNDIPIDMIERIEIYKGIIPYKFGGSALGGAINIIIKDYPPKYFDITYEVGSFNTHYINSVLKRNNKKKGLEFGLGGSYIHSDNNYSMILDFLDNRKVQREHDQYNKYILGASLKATKYWFNEIKWENVFNHTLQNIQGINFNVKEAYNYSTSFISALSLKRKNFFAERLDFDFGIGYNFGLFGLVDKAKQRFDWDNNIYSSVSRYGGETGSFASNGHNHSQNIMSKLNLNYIINDYHTLNLNIYSDHTFQRPQNNLMDKSLGYCANFPSKMNQITTGLSYELSLLDGKIKSATTLKNFFFSSTSKMLENYYINHLTTTSIHRSYIGWNEAIVYKITPLLLCKAAYSSEIRIPTVEELVGNGYSILPSPNLQPEQNKNINLSLLYRINNSFGHIDFELNAFHNHLSNMIRFTSDILPTMARYRNFGSVKSWGIEGDIKGDILPYLYTYMNITIQDLRDARKYIPGTQVANPTFNKRMPNIPYFMSNFGFDFHKNNLFGGHHQNTRWLLDASYIHQYFYDFEMSHYQERRIPTSFTFNTALEHSFSNNKWTIVFKIKNITNQRIYSELNRPLPGRSFYLKIRYILK